MSLFHSSTPFLATSRTCWNTCPPLTSRSLLVSVTRRRRHPSRRVFRLNSYPTIQCDSAMAIDGGSSTSSRVLLESLLYSRAFWVSKSTIAWDVDAGDGSCYLYGSKTANLSVANGEIQGYDVKIDLGKGNDKLPEHVIERFPHIRDYKSLQVPLTVDVAGLLKYQLAVAFITSGGKCTTITGLQLPGVLDELFSYNGPLGPIFSDESISLYLWAPTAQDVRVLIYREPEGGDHLEVVQLEEQNGVWSASGPLTWNCCYYVYEVSVYHPSTLKVEKCVANDPYARALSADGKRTLLVNLNSETSKPEGWDDLVDEKPVLLSFSDISVYELHVRDFSACDNTVHPDIRGGFLAFTSMDSAGMLHLKKLSKAGITHIHLLPTFHFGGVDDEKGKWEHLDFQVLESFPPDSEEQQAQVTAIQNVDGYNWGYNPVLWGVPKGSYASNPNGINRIIEFRKMVQIVPGYYLRRNLDGLIEHSTCMNNTASEHFMVERLIIDDLLNWSINYKVDGFRFDLMGHIMKRTMVNARTVLKSLSKLEDGVDGPSIYLYGEGWDFGEVANNGRGINASQFNLGGTGIGSFNDRIRDAMLGGSPFGHPLQQGFITGLFLEPNDHDHGSKSAVENMLAAAKDHIQVGMAGNLKEFVLTNYEGQEAKGCEVPTHDGAPVAYASCPIETVNYVSAHDNETLFDIVSLKTPVRISVDARCRMNHLATSMIALSQGIPFFHCGDEILRSKSLDRDSYNSGDWFNRLDFSYGSNNWGVGLPPKEKNERNWPLIKTRLADPSFKPTRSQILAALENFSSFLSIRYSSPLFRLRTANAIQERVRFHNIGPSWIPGVIAMSIEDGYGGVAGLAQLDPTYSYIVVIINVGPTVVTFTSPALQGRNLQLHPIQMNSTDDIVKDSTYYSPSGCFRIPSRTTSVFVESRSS
ncbi:pullulanase 1, chloroplastic isoform X3 [Henckelia pumila]|uniref:pullulanase 1, chloroplastic isoform X3 n=1 Tax=Henckelia pumila TaxID=405737 RepID=UPI003C6E7E47